MSVNSTSPATLFGGTWEKMSGGFLYGAVSSVGNGNGTGTATAGNNENTGSTALTIDQMPSHSHAVPAINYTAAPSSNNVVAGTTYHNDKNATQNSGITGGGKGHTHTLNNHTHNIPYMAVWVWKRTA